jgi:hypothetical protein
LLKVLIPVSVEVKPVQVTVGALAEATLVDKPTTPTEEKARAAATTATRVE